jgi:hypothetical protein
MLKEDKGCGVGELPVKDIFLAPHNYYAEPSQRYIKKPKDAQRLGQLHGRRSGF